MKADLINKVILSVLTLCLTIIGFFLVQTYNKITDLNQTMLEVKLVITRLETEQRQYVTRVEMIEYVQEHIKNN